MRKTETLIRLDKEVKAFLIILAKDQGVSQSVVVSNLLEKEKNDRLRDSV
jgi:predicted DNA-binding protein